MSEYESQFLFDMPGEQGAMPREHGDVPGEQGAMPGEHGYRPGEQAPVARPAQLARVTTSSSLPLDPKAVFVAGEGRIGRPKSGYDLVIATDGSCSGNPGPGGWAFVEQHTGDHMSGGSHKTTNNIMELTAMLHALNYAGPEKSLLLRVDSKYVIDSMTKWAPGWRRKGWKKADGKPVLNREIIEAILNLYEARTGKTDVEWVRGHNGDPANEVADTLAVKQTALHAQ